MRAFILFLFLVPVITADAQNAFSAIQATADQSPFIPAGAKYRGKLHEAWAWKDSLGANILILSYVAEYKVKSTGYSDDTYAAELLAYQYVKTDSGFKLLWKLNDIVKECPFDITCKFFKGSVTITDLNKNGIAEATVAYKLSCRSDVSPDQMKLIMHEDSIKYALRGFTCDPGNGPAAKPCVEIKDMNLANQKKPADEWEQMQQASGRYENEKDFSKAPKEFLSFARLQWRKYITEFD